MGSLHHNKCRYIVRLLFSLSEYLITQLFDDSTLKYTFSMVGTVLRFKMNSSFDKWRSVEFIRERLELKS
uniref:Ovule protein n=1 Tax=Caenorhabditis tropicalis TaxID=1561998 RepID=A0A1I7UNB9_9PELO